MMSTEAVEGQSGRIIGLRAMVLLFLLLAGMALGIMSIFGRRPVVDILLRGEPWPSQGAWGMAVGLLIAVPTVALVFRVPWFDAFRRQMVELAGRVDLSGFNPLWFSLCAGVGEEMLFRGALQPLLGLWLTSLIFTALHFQTGGFRAMNRLKAAYAVLVFLVSLLFGAVCIQLGLIAAMVTHTAADVVALTALRTAHGPAADRGGDSG